MLSRFSAVRGHLFIDRRLAIIATPIATINHATKILSQLCDRGDEYAANRMLILKTTHNIPALIPSAANDATYQYRFCVLCVSVVARSFRSASFFSSRSLGSSIMCVVFSFSDIVFVISIKN